MRNKREILSPKQKALAINLNPAFYGSFAEIGAGQEVARIFFQAGGASGTVAKTISAYDMSVSDTLYGKTPDGRYVSKERLTNMLQIEYQNICEVLDEEKYQETNFFAYANTITTINFNKTNLGHGWMGMQYQLNKNCEPNQVLLHVKLKESDALLQQQTIGILGVNLIYACLFYYQYPNIFIQSLTDYLNTDRIEIDALTFTGPNIKHIDNRLISVLLVKNNMTAASMFDRYGNVQQPADMLYKKNIMVLRGSFRPITYTGFDMLKTGFALFKQDVEYSKYNSLVFCEITLNNLLQEGDFNELDFLDRVNVLCGMGQNVMISNFKTYYKLAQYLNTFKLQSLRLIIGANTFLNVLEEEWYKDLYGGIMEAFAHLFAKDNKVYLYPAIIANDNNITDSKTISIKQNIALLYQHLLSNKKILDIPNAKKEWLWMKSHTVLLKIKSGDADWETMVPKYVSKCIKTNHLFGFE